MGLLEQMLRSLEREAPIETVLDVGANQGSTSLRYRTLFPKATIHAFEPATETYAELVQQTAADPNIHTHNIALGGQAGHQLLHVNSHSATNSLLPNSSRIKEYAPPHMCEPVGTASVSIARLDTFCVDSGIERIDFMKVDTQGYEKNVLAGAGSYLHPERIRGLFLEVLFVDLYEGQTWCDEILEIMRHHGYRLFGFTDVAADEVHGWKWADALFVSQ